MKFSESVQNDTRNNLFNSGGFHDHRPELRFHFDFRAVLVTLYHVWLDWFTFLKIGVVEVCVLGVLFVVNWELSNKIPVKSQSSATTSIQAIGGLCR